jgi:excinuclease ABC subunit C
VRPRDAKPRDVLGLARRAEEAVVHRLAFRDRRLAESRSHRFRSVLPDEELMHVVVTALYASGRRAVPPELVLPCEPADAELLTASLTGAPEFVVPRGAIEAVRALLDLDEAPEVIDCFDVSNFQGANVVASRVRFRNGVADRAGYRRFRVRGVEGQDDFAALREVVKRSLKRGVDEDDLPDLMVIDGGAQQLASALEAREETGAWSVAIVGLAKARSERTVKGRRKAASEERLFVPDAAEPIELERHTDARHLFERIRDEAHRFAITYHRKERGRIASQLDSIPGVGPAKRKALLRRFGSVVGVRQASIEELAAIPGIGRELAGLILRQLSGE